MNASIRIVAIRRLLGFSLLLGLMLSWELWTSPRAFPVVPLIEGLGLLDPIFRMILFVLSVALMVRPRSRFILPALSIVGILMVCTDLNRLQPWFYQYLFLALTLASFDLTKKPADFSLNACRALFCGLYIWAGIQKLNFNFIYETLPWVMAPVADLRGSLPLPMAGIACALSEMSIGLLLLFPKTRLWGVGIAVAMHSFILWCLGPAGHNWNTIVWPWNVSMMAFVFILFFRTGTLFVSEILRPRGPMHVAVLLAFFALPLLSFFGKWDAYLSFKLYSGNTQSAEIQLGEDDMARLPSEWRAQVNGPYISLSQWSMAVNNVPAYPEERYFKSVMKNLCGYFSPETESRLRVHQRPDWQTGATTDVVYSCADVNEGTERTARTATIPRDPSSVSNLHEPYFFF